MWAECDIPSLSHMTKNVTTEVRREDLTFIFSHCGFQTHGRWRANTKISHFRKMTDWLFAIQPNFFTTGLSNKHLEPEDTETHQHRVHITSAVCSSTPKSMTLRAKAQIAHKSLQPLHYSYFCSFKNYPSDKLFKIPFQLKSMFLER